MKQLMNRILTSIILIFIIYISLINSVILFFVLFLISFFLISEFNNLIKKIFTKKFHYFLSIFFASIYTSFFILMIWIFIIPLNEKSTISIIFLLLLCASTDIGGYVFGNIFGGKKITKISPKKTYSGLIGSFVFSIIVGIVFNKFFDQIIVLDMNLYALIITISLVSQIGDLFLSYIKRKAHVKDTGSILPGHGGILDRIDGILFALPLGILLIN